MLEWLCTLGGNTWITEKLARPSSSEISTFLSFRLMMRSNLRAWRSNLNQIDIQNQQGIYQDHLLLEVRSSDIITYESHWLSAKTVSFSQKPSFPVPERQGHVQRSHLNVLDILHKDSKRRSSQIVASCIILINVTLSVWSHNSRIPSQPYLAPTAIKYLHFLLLLFGCPLNMSEKILNSSSPPAFHLDAFLLCGPKVRDDREADWFTFNISQEPIQKSQILHFGGNVATQNTHSNVSQPSKLFKSRKSSISNLAIGKFSGKSQGPDCHNAHVFPMTFKNGKKCTWVRSYSSTPFPAPWPPVKGGDAIDLGGESLPTPKSRNRGLVFKLSTLGGNEVAWLS